MIEGIFFLIFGLAAFYITLWLFILLPARMAEARGRSAIGWVLVSLFFSPILAVFLLWVLGDAPDRNA
ncbi:hypothetical protein C0V75_00020 [Tabrizicola sp. TH137]|uniref:hypothetical protein n=1 Tax=Tabrizicola sp. TH137 TaxID=2067452 RepID=UPI000C7B7E68|nr:hypothetical protein [Tabrizicola sp. TH137]PLL13883.1 hypothetical protein C0V75_00020 [Tabrizicola sp. TH137]